MTQLDACSPTGLEAFDSVYRATCQEKHYSPERGVKISCKNPCPASAFLDFRYVAELGIEHGTPHCTQEAPYCSQQVCVCVGRERGSVTANP